MLGLVTWLFAIPFIILFFLMSVVPAELTTIHKLGNIIAVSILILAFIIGYFVV
jgi:hypothetical protein